MREGEVHHDMDHNWTDHLSSDLPSKQNPPLILGDLLIEKYKDDIFKG